MSKIEIFLPLPGMTAAMEEYFNDGVIRLGPSPVGTEIHSEGLSEEELLALGYEAAQAKAEELSRSTTIELTVDRESPFIGEFISGEEQIGWEFEFQVWSRDLAEDWEDLEDL